MNKADNIQIQMRHFKMENVRLHGEVSRLSQYAVFLEEENKTIESEGKCPKFEVIANLEVESVVNTFAVIIHLKLSHYGNDRLRKRV